MVTSNGAWGDMAYDDSFDLVIVGSAGSVPAALAAKALGGFALIVGGGFVTDEHARVLRVDGSVIAGRYATGNATAPRWSVHAMPARAPASVGAAWVMWPRGMPWVPANGSQA